MTAGERTRMAWERAALGPLAAAALLIARSPDLGRVLLAAADAALALVVLAVGRRRERRIRDLGGTDPRRRVSVPDAGAEVVGTAVAAAAIAVATAVLIASAA